MELKLFLVLLLNLTVARCTMSVGFLLYLPGNLESGTSNQAYIEADTTETFSVVLDFIHSSEDRHFSSREEITGGSGFIGIEVPEVDYWYGRVNLTGEVASTQEQFFASKDNVYIYRDAQKVTFIETDKPIYKPGQEVKFRLVTIDSQFKPDVSNISKIQVESPQGIRLAQWRNVERPQGLVDLAFQLISEPPLGEYAIRAYVDGDWVVQPFKVDEYVLPKFEITINAASYLMIDAVEYSFQVCAKYTYGQPVRGSVTGRAGKQERQYQYGYYPRPAIRLGDNEEEVDDMTDAVTFSGELDNEGCLDVTVNVTGMSLTSYDTPYWRTKMGVEATILEESTGNEFTEKSSVTNLEATRLNMELESPKVFKPSLPYQGRIKMTNPDQKPAADAVVVVTARVEGNDVHSEEYTSDHEGIVHFEIPFATKNQSISLHVNVPVDEKDDVEDDGSPIDLDEYTVSESRGYYSLDPAYSPTGRYVQMQPIYGAVSAGDSVQVRVLYTSNDSDVSSNFKFQFVARNRLYDAGATQVGESRTRRHAENTECERQVHEASGKGDVGVFIPECDELGMFISNQCHPSTGHCWCVDSETGVEVHGTRRNPGETPADCPDVGPIELPIGQIGEPDTFNVCPEGFQFADGIKKCIRIEIAGETECQRQAREADEKAFAIGSFRPNCTAEGAFTTRQCHGSTGHCWCVEEETGLEVPDTRSGPTEESIECVVTPDEASETECQRLTREADERGPLPGAFTPGCNTEGKFLNEQCHGSTGNCWCVEVEMGVEIDGTRTGPTETRVDCLAVDETECQRLTREAGERGPLLGAFTPGCDTEGKFLSEQCHGSTGNCWCVEVEMGVEIDGTRTGPTETRIDCLAASETECQRLTREADERGPLPGAFTPGCDTEGKFLSEQCHGSSGNCWCVEEEMGVEIDGTRTGPAESRVDCSESQCQREARIVDEGRLLGARRPGCEKDGTYSIQQCHGSTGHCWCVEPGTDTEVNNTRTGPGVDKVDCFESDCEREARITEEKRLIGSRSISCEEDGTYSQQQCHGSSGHCWCVDTGTGVELDDTRTGPGEDKVDCSDEVVIEVMTLPPVVLNFPTPTPVVHVDPQDLHEATFTVTITPNLSPEARLLVYYTSPEGEVVADSIKIKVNEAFENEVTLDFSSDEVKPGGQTKMTVSAEPGSLCSVGIVDKSVYVLAGDNKMTPKKLFSAFDLSVRQVWNNRRCSRYPYYRKKRSVFSPYHYRSDVQYVDSQTAFSDSGLVTLSNLDIEVAPCYDAPYIAYDAVLETAGAIPRTGRGESKDGENIRSYFPETWLWTLSVVSDSQAELDLEVPHSITDWIANGFCTNLETGVGIAPPVTLRAFQPFFLSMSLPYSIIREEKTPIKVTVFNYLEQCLVVRVTLTDSEAFVLSGDDEFTVAVPAGESTTVTYKVAAFSIGDIPIQVSAESIDDEDFLCGNEAVSGPAGTSDTVVRTLKVKPEGEVETITKSDYVCMEEGDEAYTQTIIIAIPEQHVPDTAKGEITVTGDLVGNTLSNVEELIRMPYGCGEQNLLSMVPNIVALQYLESVGESSPEIATEAKKFILAGYQRELNYRRDDNSYSAFGNSNPAGSTFLTAFVVRTYAQAKMFVDIDEDDLSVTIDWLRSIQEKDGSFRTVGYLAHKAMKGGVNNNVTLAAYVVSTFLEAGYTLEDKTVSLAFDYLNSQLDSLEDNYAATILAYAYALAQMDQFEQVYEKLEAAVIEAEGTSHWESNRESLPSYTNYYQDSAKAQNVEMTAYVLRAILLVKGFPNVEAVGSSIARWLSAQRNPRGGFSSTQDTVIGLTALAEFSKLGSGAGSDISLTIDIEDGETLEFDVTSENRFLIQRGSYEEFPAGVTINAEGVGCVLYSVSADYYIKKEKQTLDPFTLGVKAKGTPPPKRRRRDAGSSESEEEEETCDRFTIAITARYNGEDGASNMAIINFRPVSGFIFDKESLDTLKERYSFVRRYEINGDTITLYFDEITTEDIVFEVDVIKEFAVEDAKPALITILDYYENDLKVAEELEFTCGATELEVPPELVVPPESSTPSTTFTTPSTTFTTPSTTFTIPVSPTGFRSSTPTAEPDFDECAVPDVCGGPQWVCENYPGTYECVCAEGFQLDAEETDCTPIPSCPVCGDHVPEGADELICLSDFMQVMKVRVDGTFRPLSDAITNKDIKSRYYYDKDIDDACTCELTAGTRYLIIADTAHIRESSGDHKWDETIRLDDTTLVLPSIGPIKKDIQKIRDKC